jgi:hypothetical protein
VTCRPQLLEGAKQLIGLLWGEDCCRLVEDEHLAPGQQRLEDLQALLDTYRQFPDGAGRGEVKAIAGRQLNDPFIERSGIDESPPVWRCGEKEIFRDGQRGNEGEVLMDHSDPGAHRGGGIGKRLRNAIDEDLPRIGLENPRCHAHQRRLSRAVFSHERVDLAR